MKHVFYRFYKRFISERAAASIMAVIFLGLVGFGLAALVIDTSMLYAKRAEMVTAADAAALAGATVMREEVAKGLDPSSASVKNKAIEEARKFAIANGSNPDEVAVFVGQRSVELNNGETDMRYVVDVDVGTTQSNIFANFLGDPESDVVASATATWGYVYAATVGKFLPIFTFDKDYSVMEDVLLHEKIQDGNNNYGYIDIGSGMNAIKEALAGKYVDGLYISQNILDGKSGAGESLINPIETRMQDAAKLATPEERRGHMMGLVPVISWERFNAIPENFKNKHGDYAAHLKLPIEYFAYFEIIDIVKKNSPYGSSYALDPNNEYKKVSAPINYVDLVGSKPDSGLLYGRFTGEIVKARTIVEAGDQINPAPDSGGEDIAAMYAQLIR